MLVTVRDDTTPVTRLDEVLVELVEPVVVAHGSTQRLVVSLAGVFVLDPAPLDTAAVSDRAATAARRTRALLAQHLRWVPFVDWFAVAEPGSNIDVDGVVPLDLVTVTVSQGHTVDGETFDRIGQLLIHNRLVPDWHLGLPTTPERPLASNG